jgi:hypothetical protein
VGYYPVIDQTAPDQPQTVLCPGCVKLIIQISNQPIYITFGNGIPTPVWEDSEPYLPLVGSLVRGFDAFQFKAYTPAAQLPAGATQANVKLIPVAG